MPELALVHLADRLVEALQKREPIGSDARFHHAAIVFLALAGNQRALLHTVEQPRHVGIVRNHAVGDIAAGQAVGFGAAQNAQNVVLRSSKRIGFQQLFRLLPERVGDLLQRDENMSLLEGWDARRTWLPTHGATIVVVTMNVNTKTNKIPQPFSQEQTRQQDL